MDAVAAARRVCFLVGAGGFLYFVFVDSGSWPALALFAGGGGSWYWLIRRKLRRLDALYRPDRSIR